MLAPVVTHWRYLAAGGAGLFLGGVVIKGCAPTVKIETRTVTQEVIRYKVVQRISTFTGATATIDSQGNTTVSGPAIIDSSTEGSASRSTDSQTHTEPVALPGWSAALGYGIGAGGSAYYASLGRRLVGPTWIEVWGLSTPPTIGVAGRYTWGR